MQAFEFQRSTTTYEADFKDSYRELVQVLKSIWASGGKMTMAC